jgi:hypothetical protein
MSCEHLKEILQLPTHIASEHYDTDTTVPPRVARGLSRTISVKEINPQLSEIHKKRYIEDLRRLKDREPSTAFVSEATLSRN